ncbi:MAG: peptidoglycan DD-metalloendopeptidase family protein [Rhodobacteraceae bacterium]|nr:peptidoglycan DD-metalloendopeptidase family protein [Paracoccaceae bacterium]
MRLIRVFAVLACLAGSAVAAPDPAVPAAEDAARQLREAILALDAASGARNRVAALTQTIEAYEGGLAALRDALRRTSVRQAEITSELDGRRARLAELLGAMTAIEANRDTLSLLHPDGPLATARAAMLLSAVTPALQTEAEPYRKALAELTRLRALQGEVAELLQRGLTAAQGARTALSQAMQDRTDLPKRFLEDPEELTLLVDSADSLDAFAIGLSGMETDIGAPLEDFASARGHLPMPVRGSLLRRFGEADAAGIERPGLVIATRPAALVTAPWPATIRYRGPLLDYGNVMIVEPAAGYLLVLAGLGVVYGEIGDVVEAGAPLGLMGGADTMPAAIGLPVTESAGGGQTETLYMELRQGKEPVDPSAWFTETRDD